MRFKDQEIKEALKNWKQIVKKYKTPDTKKAIFQMLNTFVPFIGIWVLMYFSLSITMPLLEIN